VFFFVEYLFEDGQKRQKHVDELPNFRILLYLPIVQLFQYVQLSILAAKCIYRTELHKYYPLLGIRLYKTLSKLSRLEALMEKEDVTF
jgi:hypothetical protein